MGLRKGAVARTRGGYDRVAGGWAVLVLRDAPGAARVRHAAVALLCDGSSGGVAIAPDESHLHRCPQCSWGGGDLPAQRQSLSAEPELRPTLRLQPHPQRD